MKIRISQHQQIKNKISSKQLQDLKILQMSFEQIKDLADQLIETNPLVEIDDERSSSILKSNAEEALQFVHKKKSLKEDLIEQLSYCEVENETAAKYIIESLDDNGYLNTPLEELTEILHLSEEELNEIIKTIQSFTPPGVCCRNLQECLLIQLCFYDHPYDPLAIRIVYHHLDLLAKNKLQEIALLCEVSIEDVVQAKNHIQSLNPRPGSIYEAKAEYLIPEIFVEVVQGEIKLTMSGHRPFFKIRKVESNLDKETKEYVSTKTKEAKKIITGIEKRYDTLTRVAEELIRKQKNYFLKNERLKPLTYQQIAESLNLNASTICRCVQDKCLYFNGEIMPLKMFFSNQVKDGLSQYEIMKRVEEIIKSEDKGSPYSDQMISDLLNEKGIEISRRTVAKYRNELRFPSAKLRKQWKEN